MFQLSPAYWQVFYLNPDDSNFNIHIRKKKLQTDRNNEEKGQSDTAGPINCHFREFRAQIFQLKWGPFLDLVNNCHEIQFGLQQ